MVIKKNISAIIFSILIMILLMFLVYEFDVNWMNMSNVFFITGVVYFFPSLIIVTNATEVFSSIDYITKKVFTRRNYFKSYYEYVEYKQETPLFVPEFDKMIKDIFNMVFRS